MKASTRALLASLAAPLVALAIACGGTSSTTSGGTDGGTDALVEGSTGDGETDAGADLYPSDTTKIVVTSKGGFGIGAPDGSTCSPSDITYTLLLPARELSWKICESSDSGTFDFATGQKTIAEGDFVALSTALHGLRRATAMACGADKPEEKIVFTTPAGDVTYLDDFYFCDPKDTKAYVKGLDAVVAELGKLAK